MKDEKILTSSEVLKMLERPVVMAYGREIFNRLLKNQRHTLIYAHYPDEDIATLKWCADYLLRRKEVFVFFDYETTRYGQTICHFVAGEAGWWFGKIGYYLFRLRENHDFLVNHKYDFPPETIKTVEGFCWRLEEFMRRLEDDMVYEFEEAYNTHLGETRRDIGITCERIQSRISEVDNYLRKISPQLSDLRRAIQSKER